ncbi:GFA family protein [Novosphingobium huizhouense]|uniref:GFA family protein n=1 Tax=Novosphingobium huizhouense TaxID=2866625 RepID=UPI001CD8D62D|nr:GFA family protein [Novosphingobium huizhouense]
MKNLSCPNLTCHCGAISVTIDTRPDFVFACNCSLCRKTGARWGYFAPEQVQITGQPTRYRRTDKPDPSAEIAFCPTCGATTHFTLTESAIAAHGNTMMGVNMALLPESDLAGIELRYPDGANWDGASPFDYVRPPRVLG